MVMVVESNGGCGGGGMEVQEKRLLEREALRNMIQQWNANRLDLFELSEPNENLEFHGVMRFYFQDSGQKVATKCIRVASDATVSDVIETLIEKFRPDMRMLSVGSYSLWETRGPSEERKLEPHEKPLLVQLNWHADDREGRFLLKCTNGMGNNNNMEGVGNASFKRKLSKREKKELKKKEKLSRMKSESNDHNDSVAGAQTLYNELPETSFTRSISNPEAVMRRRRQQKLERRLQQFRSKDGGPDTGGTLKIYGSSLSPDVPYKTILVSIGDCASAIVREMLDKYGMDRTDPNNYSIVQVNSADGSETVLEDDDCPLAILMTHPQHSSIMFHVRRRPADSQLRRRKKKSSISGSASGNSINAANTRRSGGDLNPQGSEPILVEIGHDGTTLDNARRLRLNDALEVGSGNGAGLQLYGPNIQSRHCVVAPSADGGYCITPLHADALVMVDGQPIQHSTHLRHNSIIQFGRAGSFRFIDPTFESLQHSSNYEQYGSGSMYSLDSKSGERSEDISQQRHHHEASEGGASVGDITQNSSVAAAGGGGGDNYETTFDLEGNVETKSVCSAGSAGRDSTRVASSMGQEAILPAVLEFPEATQAAFLNAVITTLDPNAPSFKLAPVYTLYLCARYRASTHYRPELSPTERAHKLSGMLSLVSEMINATVMERRTDPLASAFWLANGSELLHFLKHDRHIRTYAARAQTQLAYTNTSAFSNLVGCLCSELSGALEMFNSRSIDGSMQPAAPLLRTLGTAMLLLRRCRVNAALTIQVFSHLFHFINAVCFNELIRGPPATSAWARELTTRLATVATWAERQGLELAAECHLARVSQAARLLQADKTNADNLRRALQACFKLNSLQVRALLCGSTSAPLVEAAVRAARAHADELNPNDLLLEEPLSLHATLLVPADGFSAEVVRGVPPGLVDFLAPLQRAGLCRLTHQPHSIGAWTVYMNGYNAPPMSVPVRAPVVQVIRLHKNANGMGLSIVAAKGAGQSKLGIYVKSVVAGGAAAADGRLAAGDQLLSVDGHSLVGISQERAAEFLLRTGPIVTLEVAKQGALLHGLATLLTQPQDIEERKLYRSGSWTNPALQRPLPSRLELATASDHCCRSRHIRSSSESSTTSSESDDSRSTANNLYLHHNNITIIGRPQQLPLITLTCDSDSDPPHDIIEEETTCCELKNEFKTDVCASACACCRNGQWESAYIPYVDEIDAQVQEATITRTIFDNNEATGRISRSVQVDPPKIIISEVDDDLDYAKNSDLEKDLDKEKQVDKEQDEKMRCVVEKVEKSSSLPNIVENEWRDEIGATLEAWSRWGINAPNRWPGWRAEGVKASKSVPALHHIAPNTSGAAGESSRSLSSHNLSDNCYQNLPPRPIRQHMQQQHDSNQLGPIHLSHEQLGPRHQQQQRNASHEGLHNMRGSIASHEQSRGSVASHETLQSRGSIASHGPLSPISPYHGGPLGPISPQSGHIMSPLPQSAMSPTQSLVAQHEYARAQMMSGYHDLNRTQELIKNEQLSRRSTASYEYDTTSLSQQQQEVMNEAPPPPVTRPPPPHVLDDDNHHIMTTSYGQQQHLDMHSKHDNKTEQQLQHEATTPKSILKWRDHHEANTQRDLSDSMDDVAREVATMRLNNQYPQQQAASPPPPPERASSFAIMNAVATTTPTNQRDSSSGRESVSARDKRVSFHERQSETTLTSDPDSFLLEEAVEAAGSVSHTPGVIGAQEVYRDPRTKRLAEKAAKAPQPPQAPDQLSFREKMKLFALESGENNTPKDKLKVSRAQRDIDAVH